MNDATRENLNKGIDQAINILKRFKDTLSEKDPDCIQMRIEQGKDLKPFFEFGSVEPTGLIQKGNESISIVITDATNDGKIFK